MGLSSRHSERIDVKSKATQRSCYHRMDYLQLLRERCDIPDGVLIKLWYRRPSN
jgi:hypothetical protein